MDKEQLIELLKRKMIIKKGFKQEDKKMAFLERFLDEHLSKINPTYYDFIYRYFNRDNIILRLKNFSGASIISYFDKLTNTLVQELQVSESEQFYFNLCHEIGHGVNRYICELGDGRKYQERLTSLLLDHSCLEVILHEEIKTKAKPLINKIIKDYKMMLKNEYYFDILDRYIDNYDLFKEKDSLYRKLGGRCHFIAPDISSRSRAAVKNGTFYHDLERYKEIEKILESKQATDVDKKIRSSRSRDNILSIYTEALCESLIPFYDAEKYHLFRHRVSYFDDERTYGDELFANFFAYKLTDDEESLFTLKTYLPEAYKKCEEIFNLIMSNYDFSITPTYLKK